MKSKKLLNVVILLNLKFDLSCLLEVDMNSFTYHEVIENLFTIVNYHNNVNYQIYFK